MLVWLIFLLLFPLLLSLLGYLSPLPESTETKSSLYTNTNKTPGLFAPRVGQQYRDEQRRRRSQFDRGTTAAEREAYFVRSSSSFTTRRGALNGNGSGNGNLSCSMMLPVMMSPCYEGPVSGAGGDAGPRSS